MLLAVGLARCIGQIGDFRRILNGSGVGVFQGIGLTVESVGEGVIGFVELAVPQRFPCLIVIKSQLFQSIDQRIVEGVGLYSDFGFVLTRNHFFFRFLRLRDRDGVRQSLAEGVILLFGQFGALTLVDVVDLFGDFIILVLAAVQFFSDLGVGKFAGGYLIVYSRSPFLFLTV